MVPFRESKLTRLFQNYFVGKGKGVRQGKITMFVNVSNSTSVFDENIHVLKFSALASKVWVGGWVGVCARREAPNTAVMSWLLLSLRLFLG